ncbi:hypothetical protein AA103196_2827 [Ameyamaea chiangmaiensis NBRC 103196]|nr:hypothetical protein AA103196_2827 [Ameyamaea chiangmaiensis NBRC 103196]
MDFFRALQDGIESGWIPTLSADDVSCPDQSALPPTIPRRISQYWHSETLPEDVARSIEKVRHHNPGFEMVLTHDDAARAFLEAHFGRDMVALFDACFHPTMRSDLWRVCDLYVHGGVYIDVDIAMHAPIAHVTGRAVYDCFLMYAIGAPWCIENGLIIARRHHPALEEVLHALTDSLTRFRSDPASFENIWVNTGPGVTTVGIVRHLLATTPETASQAGGGCLLGHHGRGGASYGHDELAYKASPAGNWRTARPPAR